MVHSYTNIYFFAIALLSASTQGYASSIPMLFTGVIQFPKQVQHIPSIVIYSLLGCKVPSSIDNQGHRLTYSINRPRDVQRFWLVITHHLIPIPHDKAEQNTLQGWRIDITQPYKFYGLTRIVDELPQTDNNHTTASRIRWDIQSHDLTPFHGQLPDDTIIIYYDPLLIAGMRGGNPCELPTLVLKDDILSTLGSEELLHDLSEKLSIAAVDLRHFFAPTVECEIRQTAQVKTIMTLSAT